jgi:hypothetical protein
MLVVVPGTPANPAFAARQMPHSISNAPDFRISRSRRAPEPTIAR